MPSAATSAELFGVRVPALRQSERAGASHLTSVTPLLQRYDNTILDLDGCVWIGDRATPRAPEAIAEHMSRVSQRRGYNSWRI